MRLLPVGACAWLIEVDDGDQAMSLYDHLLVHRPPSVVDLVPGHRTVLVDGACRSAITDILGAWDPAPPPSAAGALVAIAVRYDGEDLDEVASLAGWTIPEVVAAHTSSDLRVAFCGFAPGFAYITGLPAPLHLPRLATPRTSVPAGSVAVAGGFTGVYPRRSPGGWRIIGHTAVELWNASASPPALLAPGTRVRFTAT